jgi:lipopolysaccharide export system protein LptA
MSRALASALLLAALCGAALAGAAEPPAKGDAEPKAPTPPPAKEGEAPERLQAWADKILYHDDTGKFTFTGKVLVLKGELRVDCSEMEGLVDAKTHEIVKIIATGEVSLSTVDTIKIGTSSERPATTSDAPDAWRATCSKADYDLKAGKIIMTSAEGKPRPQLRRAQGNGEADTIIFFPTKGEYELIGNPVIRGEIPTGPAKPPKRSVDPKAKGKEEPKGKDAPPPKQP